MKAAWERAVAAYRSELSVAPPVGRWVVRGLVLVMALSGLNLVLSLVLAPLYVDWSLHAHGWTRATAPPGEVAGIWLGLGLRAVFALAWLRSFSMFLDLVGQRGWQAVWVLRLYAFACCAGYGYVLFAGGPVWMVPAHVVQCAVGVGILLVGLTPQARHWLSTEGASAVRVS